MITKQCSLSSPLSLVQWTILRPRKHSYRCFLSLRSDAPPTQPLHPRRWLCSLPQLDSVTGRRYSASPSGGLEPNNPSPVVPTSASSSDTTAPPPSVVSDDKSSATFRDALKKQSGAQAQAQKPRPVFPWRHDLLPIPRLVPGTKEHEEAGRTFLSGWVSERTAAVWFLNVPFVTVIFRFSSWKQTMADQAAYAFAQGVAGILSNVYQMPLESVSVEDEEALPIVSFSWNDDEEEEEEDDKQQPVPNNETAVDTTTEAITSLTDSLHPTVVPEQRPPMSASDGSTNEPSSATQEQISDMSDLSIPESLASSPINETADASTTAMPQTSTVSPTKDESNVTESNAPESLSAASMLVSRHPAFQRPLVHKTYVDPSPSPPPSTKESPPPPANAQTETKVEDPKPAVESEGETKWDLDVNEMMIEPLRKLYESAHESGRDQLIIRLQTKPVEAAIYNLTCIPYVSREVALKNPQRLQETRLVKFGQAGMTTVLDNLEHDLDEKGKLETTVEMQVLISCLESFQVLDRETGAVLQGSPDGLLQEVTHLVRFETTSVQEIKDGRAYNYFTNWKITDIDDMLGHVAWYQK
jgi:hypothetical protein